MPSTRSAPLRRSLRLKKLTGPKKGINNPSAIRAAAISALVERDRVIATERDLATRSRIRASYAAHQFTDFIPIVAASANLQELRANTRIAKKYRRDSQKRSRSGEHHEDRWIAARNVSINPIVLEIAKYAAKP